MQIGLIGLGKMGYNLALNMRDNKVDIKAYARNQETLAKMDQEGGVDTYKDLGEMVASLEKPRVVWMMITAGKPVDMVIDQLIPMVEPGDIIVDGGNSRFSDTLTRAAMLKEKGIHFVDAGTSGGTDGARNGACMMVGGPNEAVDYLAETFTNLNVEDGYLHCGDSGAGHYVKMIHNGIEYGMMQAIGEGFNILKAAPFDLDFRAISHVWNSGSIIEGYLMECMESAFANNGNEMEDIQPIIDANGEGEWTVEESIRLKVPAPVIANSVYVRYMSRDTYAFSDRVVAALRNEFGGHKLHKK